MLIFVQLVVFCVVGVATVCSQWVNGFDGDSTLECHGNQLLYFIGSEHSNRHEDRRWQFQCRESSSSVTGCSWTGFLNNFDQTLMYLCPGDQVMNGMSSYHSNRHEDRRFKLQCCNVAQRTTRNCYFTDYINNWDGIMHFIVPEGKVVKGVYSHHDNKKEDRRWKINLCDLA